MSRRSITKRGYNVDEKDFYDEVDEFVSKKDEIPFEAHQNNPKDEDESDGEIPILDLETEESDSEISDEAEITKPRRKKRKNTKRKNQTRMSTNVKSKSSGKYETPLESLMREKKGGSQPKRDKTEDKAILDQLNKDLDDIGLLLPPSPSQEGVTRESEVVKNASTFMASKQVKTSSSAAKVITPGKEANDTQASSSQESTQPEERLPNQQKRSSTKVRKKRKSKR